LGLRNAFLQRFRSTVDEVLGFFQAQARYDFANDLDNSDLVAARSLKNNVKRVLLFSRSRTAVTTGTCAGRRDHDRSSSGRGGNAENLFKFLDQFGRFEKRHTF